MKSKVVKRGIEEKHALLICAVDETHDEHEPGVVSHIIGTDEVVIRGMRPSDDVISIIGREHIELVRDACEEVLRWMDA